MTKYISCQSVPRPKQLVEWVITLAGMVGGFTAEFNEKADKAVLAAVYAHSAIAEKIAESQYIVLPHQISRALPAFMKKMEGMDEDHHIGFLN